MAWPGHRMKANRNVNKVAVSSIIVIASESRATAAAARGK